MMHDPDAQEMIAQEISDSETQQQVSECIKLSSIATLTGTATVYTDRGKPGGQFSKDVSLALEFSDDRTRVSIDPVDITTASGAYAASDRGIGDFCHSSGLMEIPTRVRVSKSGITLNFNFTLSTESGEAYGPFTPRGARLETDGSVTLAGAAYDSVFGIGVNVLLVISGTVQPLP
ncbi:MAG: hypothetical protein ACRDR6_10485 [Pseudonocardiaceae bacterium]